MGTISRSWAWQSTPSSRRPSGNPRRRCTISSKAEIWQSTPTGARCAAVTRLKGPLEFCIGTVSRVLHRNVEWFEMD